MLPFYSHASICAALPKWCLRTSLELDPLPRTDDHFKCEITRPAARENWRVLQLRDEIAKRAPRKQKGNPLDVPLLIEPKRGQFGVRRVGWLKSLQGSREKVVDLGFHAYRALSASEKKRLKEGDSVVWVAGRKAWIKQGSADDFYHYRAQVEKVVDGLALAF